MLIDNINSILSKLHPNYDPMKFENLSENKFEELLNSSFSDMKKAASYNNVILRGIKEKIKSDFFMLTPSKRISENTSNVYTRLMSDILPSWSEYPKRNESFICTTSQITARSYGNGQVFTVYPLNGAKIAFCPDHDIWYSFIEHGRIVFLPGFMTELLLVVLYFLNYEKDTHYRALSSSLEYKALSEQFIFATNEEIKNLFNDVNKQIIKFKRNFSSKTIQQIQQELFSKNENNSNFYSLKIVKGILDKEDILLYLDDLLNPKKNKFRLVTTSTLAEKRDNNFNLDREVWMSGPCLFERFYT